jgi:hypothetical protein
MALEGRATLPVLGASHLSLGSTEWEAIANVNILLPEDVISLILRLLLLFMRVNVLLRCI